MASRFSNFFARISSKKTLPDTPKSVITMSGGTYVTPDSCMEVSAFYRGVTYISTQIAKLPWVVKDATNKTLLDDRVTKLLRLSPNPEMNTFMFRLFMIQNALIYGNAFAEIERDNLGRPIALWPIRSTDVELTRAQNGSLVYRILGGSTEAYGEDAFLLPKDVYHIRNFYTKDGLVGQGIVRYASETLGIALGSSRFANGLYGNGAMPSGVLKTAGNLSDEAFARLKSSWKEAHGGRKIGGTAILEEGVSFEPISLDPNVLQFLESRKFSVFEIARFLGIPPTKLYDGDSATYNNIEHSNLEVATDTLDAWARNFEVEADIKLLSNGYGGRRTEIDIYSVFRGDMKTRSDYFKSRMSTASMTPNEIRVMEGEAPYEGGDRYFLATNNFTPMDRVDEMLDSQKNKEVKKTEEDKKTEEAIVNYLNRPQ